MREISKSENLETATSGMQSIQMGKDGEKVSQEKVQKPYVVIRNPGMDNEEEVADFDTMKEAARYYTREAPAYEYWDVMKRDGDGNLTTEF